MDEETRDLVRQLCTRAGMMMEDASLLAVTMPANADDAFGAALGRLTADAASIQRLLAAASDLAGRSD